MSVIRRARTNRTSIRVTIPKFVCDSLNIVEGTELEIKLDKDAIMIVPVQTAKSELAQADTPAKRHLHESYI